MLHKSFVPAYRSETFHKFSINSSGRLKQIVTIVYCLKTAVGLTERHHSRLFRETCLRELQSRIAMRREKIERYILFLPFDHDYVISELRFYRWVSVDRFVTGGVWELKCRILEWSHHGSSCHPPKISAVSSLLSKGRIKKKESLLGNGFASIHMILVCN